MLCTEFLGENETWPLTGWRTQSTGEETRVTKLTKRPTTVVKSVTRHETSGRASNSAAGAWTSQGGRQGFLGDVVSTVSEARLPGMKWRGGVTAREELLWKGLHWLEQVSRGKCAVSLCPWGGEGGARWTWWGMFAAVVLTMLAAVGKVKWSEHEWTRDSSNQEGGCYCNLGEGWWWLGLG